MANITIPGDLLDTLQKLAETEQLSVNQLVEEVLKQYATERELLLAEDEISDEEIAAVLEAAAEFDREEAEGTLFSLEEVKAEMLQMIKAYQAPNKQAKKNH